MDFVDEASWPRWGVSQGGIRGREAASTELKGRLVIRHSTSSSPSGVIRVGVMPFLLGLPLVYGLDKDRPEGFVLEFDVPSALAERLGRGKLDLALVPAVEFFRQPGLLAVPGLCVACDGPVESIRLFHMCPLPEVSRVALDLSSRTAAALVRVLFERFWRIRPEYADCPPDLEQMLASAQAALLIGDHALSVETKVPYVDCGEEWKRRTGLPFVFALWAVRSEVVRRRGGGARITQVLHASYARGREALGQIAAEQAASRGMNVEAVARYLGQSIQYELTEEKLRGLMHFRELGTELGLFSPDGPDVTFLS